jgi:hypothetical protein
MAFRKNASVKGLDKVIRNLNKEIVKIQGRTAKGLIEAAAWIHEDTTKTSPMTPLDLGNLRASWFYTVRGAKAEGILFSGSVASKGRYKGSLSLRGKLERHHNLAVSIGKKKISKYKIGIAFGYGAFYASYVHEMKGVNWTTSGTGGRWFQKAIKRNKVTIIEIVRRNAMIKKTG